MRYRLLRAEGGHLFGGNSVYHDDDIEAAKYLRVYETSEDGVVFSYHPSDGAVFYLPETHPLYNASIAGAISYNRDRSNTVNDITYNQLMTYLDK